MVKFMPAVQMVCGRSVVDFQPTHRIDAISRLHPAQEPAMLAHINRQSIAATESRARGLARPWRMNRCGDALPADGCWSCCR